MSHLQSGNFNLKSNFSKLKDILFLGFFSLFAFLTFYLEMNVKYSFLPTLSFILILVIAFFNVYKNDLDFFSPLTIFSIMYVGYALGGLYYSDSDGYFGKFIAFLDLEPLRVVELMRLGLVYAIISFIFFGLGYSLYKRPIRFKDSTSHLRFWRFYARYYYLIVIPFLLIGLVYWYWIAQETSGGIVNMLIYFQAFRHLAEDAQVSTLPYHFYYAGIYLWLLAMYIRNGKVNIYFILFSFIGFVINLSQGRITLAVTFILSQMFFFALADEKLRKKIFVYFISLMLIAFAVYFLRVLSNSLFIGSDANVIESDFLGIIIGGGNISDLQQLVIIFHTFSIGESTLGFTYIDWFRNTMGQFLGMDPSSVGLTIKQLYVPDSSGAPTPGAIGEAFVNFNIAGPIVLFFIGAFFAILYKFVMKRGNSLLLLIYSVFLARFIFIYPKVDSTMLINFLWGVTPFLLGIVVFFIFYILVIRTVNDN